MSIVPLVLELFYEDAADADAQAKLEQPLFLLEAETLQSMQQHDDFLSLGFGHCDELCCGLLEEQH